MSAHTATRRPRYSVEQMSEGEILVRGTLDPSEALRVYVEHMHEIDDSPLFGAVRDLADRLHGMLANYRSGYYRKVHCLPSSYGYGEAWAYEVHQVAGPGRGVFKAVEFR